MAARRKPGPAKWTPDRRKGRCLQVMLREAEHAAVKAAAGEEALSVWARDVLLGAAEAAKPLKSRNVRELREALTQRSLK